MTGPARIVVRCDAGRRLGSGHVMRCLTLAHALAGRGATVEFACSAETLETVPLGASGFPVITLAAPLEADELVATGRTWDAMIVDHYGLEARHETAFRHVAPVLLVIDDLADRPHDCDILVDQTAGREPCDYAGLVSPATDLRLGARYALLRPEFARARPRALAARSQGGPVSRILVSLGMTDIDGVTAWAVKAALAAGLDAEIAVAVGSRGDSVPELRALAAADPRVVLHLDCADMCSLMAGSDIAVGAAGTTSWERCCLGLPSIVLIVAENQTVTGRNLAEMGAVELLSGRDAAAIGAALQRLAADPAARMAMSRAASAVTDGNGAARITDVMMDRHRKGERPMTCSQSKAPNQLTVRPATLQDAKPVWLWRNDPVTRSYSQNTSFIPWEDHVNWFTAVLSDSCRVVCMVMPATNCINDVPDPIAVVRFDRLPVTTAHWLVNLNLCPKSRGLGLGRPVLLAACQALFDHYGVQVLRAEIHPQNIASKRVFGDLGFILAPGGKAAGFDLYERPAAPLSKRCDSESLK